MRWRVAVKGAGRVELAAYGIADAEHQAEKEARDAWPGARVEITDAARVGARGKIVEEFAIAYRLHGSLDVDAETEDDAARAAFRSLRDRFSRTRHRIAWEKEKASRRDAEDAEN